MQKSKLMLCVGATAIAMSVCLFSACKKEKDKGTTTTTTEDTEYATDQSYSEKAFDDVQTISDKASENSGSGYFKTTGCATITKTPGVITVDFGAANCMCADGRNRRGKIIITYTGAYKDSASTHTVTFDNYYQNDNKVEGTKTVTNMGRNSAGQPYFNITVNGTITKASGDVITASWTRVRTWVDGYATPLIWKDDVYHITGSGTITRPKGKVNVEIPAATPLVVSLDCKWIEAGAVIYTLPDGKTRTLNYGATPVCDNSATITLPTGAVKTITLP